VLINLLENAADALADVPGECRRIAVATTAAGGTATVRVSDGGPGVPSDALPRLFEPFGIDAHGGRIVAENVPGAGASFRIDLVAAR
jgi:C4-dicarboxylate-specific signal transduction histidine kinase